MRVFVYEYLCGGAAPAMTPSLRREGWAMLSAALNDFCACPQISVVTRLDPALSDAMPWPKNLTIQTGGVESEADDIRALAGRSDYTLLIAPEFKDLLGSRCQWVEEAGGRLLGPSAAAVRLTSDKLRFAAYLQDRQLPTPRSVSLSDAEEVGFPLVVKPRDGAGSQATFLVRNRAELHACPQKALDEGWQGEVIAQAFVPGVAASVTLLTGPGGKFCLKPVWQDLSSDGRFRYLGGGLPLTKELAAAAKALAVRVLPAVEGLRGWCGVDVVLHPGGGSVIEINPRLTTSYVGLRRLAKCNLMDMLLGVAAGRSLPLVEWAEIAIYFRADGTVIEGDRSLLTFRHHG